ncbi:MAG TPA: PilZ domain-containing protein [Terracidiphilus sp.]|jgi:hypothetical protein|nr:PilZ domain-containing protein [Terracidiphilus sp.]
MSGNKGWLGRLLTPPRADRRPADHFAAYRLSGATIVQSSVRDISPTGVYLLTKEHLPLGTRLSLNLQREGPLELNSARRITTLARVARVGEDGVGVEFVVPQDSGARRWAHLVESLAEQTRPQEMLTFLRMCDAIVFLSRICPHASEEIEQLFQGRLSNHKVKNAVEIAVKAESLVASDPAFDSLRADSNLVVRILEVGSCVDEEALRNQWAGLLSVCCRAEANSAADGQFVDLFSQLTLAQIRIVNSVCARSIKAGSDGAALSGNFAAFKIEELAFGITLREAQIERDLEILSELGLLQKAFDDSRALLMTDTIDLGPTPLGLELYGRCQGHRGTPEGLHP